MATSLMSKKRAHALTFALFLVGIALLIYLKSNWWPSIMLVIGLPLALRQYLLGRRFDMGLSLLIFLGVFITVQFDVATRFILPLLLTVGGLYIFLREFIAPDDTKDDEQKDQDNIKD
jgi:hypothetical protein